MRDLTKMGKAFESPPLNLTDFDTSPFIQFEKWLKLAIEQSVPEANAVILSTADEQNQPNSRVLLLKQFDETGFVFFGHYHSQKGKELASNPKASLLFWWGPLNRQIRLQGRVHKETSKSSAEYFHSRPLESQIAAIVSPQSKEIESKEALNHNYQALLHQHQNENTLPDCPDYWGGYKFVPHRFEFWQGGANRLHDRFVYLLDEKTKEWVIRRLAP